jgi:hypothetical protein
VFAAVNCTSIERERGRVYDCVRRKEKNDSYIFEVASTRLVLPDASDGASCTLYFDAQAEFAWNREGAAPYRRKSHKKFILSIGFSEKSILALSIAL